MMSAVASGLFAALGTLLILDACRRPSLERLLRRHAPDGVEEHPGVSSVLAIRLGGSPADLAVLGLTDVDHVNRRVIGIAIGFVAPLVVLGLGAGAGFEVSPITGLLVFVSSVVLGVSWPERRLVSRATAARSALRASLSAYLDLVAIQLAGGAGMDTAFTAASRLGTGPAFVSIAAALEERRVTRVPMWSVFAELGERLEVTELSDLASSVKLGGEHGARLTASLVARARAMRHRQMSEVEAKANASTERMGLPMVAIFIGFLVLLGYPAVDLINNGFA